MTCTWVTAMLNVQLRKRRLKEKGRSFRESFLAKLGLLLRGTVAAPPERFGETLADEHIRGGGYCLNRFFAVAGGRNEMYLLQ